MTIKQSAKVVKHDVPNIFLKRRSEIRLQTKLPPPIISTYTLCGIVSPNTRD